MPNLTATGAALTWYSDAALTNVVGNGSPFATGQTAAGIYTYYVTQTTNGCEGTFSTVVTSTFYAPSVAPTSTTAEVCPCAIVIPNFTVTRTALTWYSVAAFTNVI